MSMDIKIHRNVCWEVSKPSLEISTLAFPLKLLVSVLFALTLIHQPPQATTVFNNFL